MRRGPIDNYPCTLIGEDEVRVATAEQTHDPIDLISQNVVWTRVKNDVLGRPIEVATFKRKQTGVRPAICDSQPGAGTDARFSSLV